MTENVPIELQKVRKKLYLNTKEMFNWLKKRISFRFRFRIKLLWKLLWGRHNFTSGEWQFFARVEWFCPIFTFLSPMFVTTFVKRDRLLVILGVFNINVIKWTKLNFFGKNRFYFSMYSPFSSIRRVQRSFNFSMRSK